MQIRGQEIEMWGNAINEVVLQQTRDQQYLFVTANEPNEFDEILKLLIDANTILETMITASAAATTSVELSLPEVNT